MIFQQIINFDHILLDILFHTITTSYPYGYRKGFSWTPATERPGEQHSA
ncbi:hypothetical protein T08_13153 [Trichinella sp. T8]|nr:hypothetical protein T08_13153 [Trichinella sp. T8]